MVDLSAYLDPGHDEPPGGGGDQDLEALKACLKALADAIASTNLAVLSSSHGDLPGAGARVQASVAALQRFSQALAVLEGEAAEEEDTDEEER